MVVAEGLISAHRTTRGRMAVRLAQAAAALALVVVVVGAYVRLSHAGLGCPDWPGCYGHIEVPQKSARLSAAALGFPGHPLQPAKAWKEMAHRYLAGTLGLLVFCLAALALRRGGLDGRFRALPLALAILVIGQALLGMWTVTLQLQPIIVMAHLLGGMTMLGLLWWLALRLSTQTAWAPEPALDRLRPWALGALLVLAVQIALGGWTSANYAAFACPDFPTCQGHWWPTMDFAAGFAPWHPLGIDYEGGVLSTPARTAIQVVHRIGALTVLLYLGGLAIAAWRSSPRRGVRTIAAALLGLVLAQVTLGAVIAVFLLPLPEAAAHNAGAALLLVTVVILNHRLNPITPRSPPDRVPSRAPG